MNGYKILKCFRKKRRVSGELPCPATGLTGLNGNAEMVSHSCQAIIDCYMNLLKTHNTEETVENLVTCLFYLAELGNTLDQNSLKMLAFNKEDNYS